jgi:3-oxoacyl-[acyl-carrier-protein] synthase III
MTSILTGLGVAVPGRAVAGRAVTNDDMAATLDTSDAWIRTRTGISSRYFVDPSVDTSDLAVAAGEQAMKSAGADDLGGVVVATATPDRPMPATATEVAARLGAGGVPAFDVNAACAGFVYALATAAGWISAGIADRVLVIGAEVYSRIVDQSDRSTAVLFGDGAGAVVLERPRPDAEQPDLGAVGPFDLGSDGDGADFLCIPAGGVRQRIDAEALARHDQFLKMDGKEVYRQAVRRMTESSRRVLERAGLTVDDVDSFVGHQANIRILGAVADRLGIPEQRRFTNVAKFGNTSAASIPLALSEAELAPGSTVLLTAFGAGFSWGSALVRWPDLRAT